MKRVAIFQNAIVQGGRFRVILSIIEILNAWGIIPEVCTLHLCKSPDELMKAYGKDLKFRVKLIKYPASLPNELQIPYLNLVMRMRAIDYDMLVNSNNSLLLLPPHEKCLTYMHFPQKYRMDAELWSLHFVEGGLEPSWKERLVKRVCRSLYRLNSIRDGDVIVANSLFTLDALMQIYGIDSNAHLSVVYPPVKIDEFRSQEKRLISGVCTLGRLSEDKRQLEQIEIARQLPRIQFHIMGSTNSDGGLFYLRRCKDLIKHHSISNVLLHQNVPFEEVKRILHSSTIFLHSMRNEPFGISTVEAIAAGCVPVVHDSGGQKEVVAREELRYSDTAEAAQMIDNLCNKGYDNLESLREELQEHIRQFDERYFKSKMQRILEEKLGVISNEKNEKISRTN